jgi:hypothetical protein
VALDEKAQAFHDQIPCSAGGAMKIVALLDSMWTRENGPAPRYFRISADNHSGRRLYELCGHHRLLVTNSCSETQLHANAHGTPEPDWVAANLRFLASERMDVLLVCGRVAQQTYDRCGFAFPNTLRIDHPAARRWTRAAIEQVKAQIAGLETAR